MEEKRKIHRKGPVSGSNAKNAVFFLHGYGADGADLFDLHKPFSMVMPNAEFISPDAPHDCAMSTIGKEWFPIEKIPFGAAEASKDLLIFLETECKSLSISLEQIVLIGFSQGAMMSLQTLLISPKKFRAIIAFSGRLSVENINLSESNIENGKHKNHETPILLVHGEKDEVVHFDSLKITKDLLTNIGFNVKKLSRPDLGHGIDPDGVSAGMEFLKQINF